VGIEAREFRNIPAMSRARC
jgi:hypothetical protein